MKCIQIHFLITFSWTSQYAARPRPRSRTTPTETPGVTNCNLDEEASANDFFSLVWDDAIWETLVRMTNKQAEYIMGQNPEDYYGKKWYDVTIEEMKAFMGVRLSMEYALIKPRYEDYWKSSSHPLHDTPGYRNIFSRDRWLAIWKFLHYVDEQETEKDDKLYKLRPLVNRLVDNFQSHYVLSQDVSIDEGMIPSKNRLGFKQYLKDKPVKWGIKTFMLCESKTGYIYDLEIYTGKQDGIFLPELGAAASVVVRLTQNLPKDTHVIHMDRYYSSPLLYRYLLSTGYDACGSTVVL